ncbi:GrpE protein [Rhodomicrobium vannielii ATCC 17100]|uniref:Protein GrpE n=1 Tax=Rhodomicrobium vannielii (strain ATCC 17100 / DSM 162 / LMG 4299 / NCIMB 10020 / ATH 3.1.1) TaxID=648757 RepID=E3I3I8_RHOVT|nr:nucleotide exchange factor GrpE [Rhodomicrobium vannielii]ADP72636.1 GrpE protein [Rhodomicrobium vannielii ATCC 17100]
MNDTPDGPSDANGPENNDSLGRDQNPQATEEQVKALAKMLADSRAENAELRDRHLRIAAEMENYRRRSEREKIETAKYASSEFGKDAIVIADNLRRAIEAAQKEATDQTPALNTLLQGVEVTERELLKVFERHGITRFEPLGEKFDPHTSEAMIKVDVPNVPADVVVQVLQAGYKIGERVLRPAAVIVAKGGAPVKPEPPQGEHSAKPVSDAPSAPHGEPHHDHHAVEPAHEHDPDVFRDPSGAPLRRDRSGGDKRASSVTQPVTENSGPAGVDDLISSFGKRLENGN